MDMGNNAPGYTDKMSPWDVWRVAEALNAKGRHPDHHDNWANCHEDPTYLTDIVARKNKENRPEMKAVILLPGARYIHPDDQKHRSLRLSGLAGIDGLEKEPGVRPEQIKTTPPEGGRE